MLQISLYTSQSDYLKWKNHLWKTPKLCLENMSFAFEERNILTSILNCVSKKMIDMAPQTGYQGFQNAGTLNTSFSRDTNDSPDDFVRHGHIQFREKLSDYWIESIPFEKIFRWKITEENACANKILRLEWAFRNCFLLPVKGIS